MRMASGSMKDSAPKMEKRVEWVSGKILNHLQTNQTFGVYLTKAISKMTVHKVSVGLLCFH